MGTDFTVNGEQAYRDRTSLRTFISPQFVKETQIRLYYLRCSQKPTACWQDTGAGIFFPPKATCSYLTSTGLAEQSAFSKRSVDTEKSS